MLPIPTILENAANVIKEARKIAKGSTADAIANLDSLKEALTKVHEDDLLAVMNEVGKVYTGMHNIQVRQIGAQGNVATGDFEVAIEAEYGLGPRMIIVRFPLKDGETLCKNFATELAKLKVGSGALITDANFING